MHRSLFAALLFLPALAAQNYYIPDNLANAGTCNVIPLGGSGPGSFYNQKYQTIVTAADLGSVPGVITGLGFAACGSGNYNYATIDVVMDHIAPSSVLSTTFASNLTANAVTVLSATNYTWANQQHTWCELGLQNFFVYNGVSDLVIEITVTNSTWIGGSIGHHRDTRQRVYAIGWSGSPPATGSTGGAALKMEIGSLMARLWTYGRGCPGTTTPVHTLGGSSQLGQTVQFQLASAPANALAFLAVGFGNGSPFPIELSGMGMPGCYQYFGITGVSAVIADAAGNASSATPVPNNPGLVGILFYSQFAVVDPPANATGLSTTNYGRVLVGN